AVQHALEGAATLAPPELEQLAEGVGLFATHMERDGQGALPGQRELPGEHPALDLARGAHVVVVEAALADRDDARVREPAGEELAPARVELRRLVRVDADRREDARVGLRELERARVGEDPVARADRDQALEAAGPGAREDVAAVRVEVLGADVAVAVEPHARRWPRGSRCAGRGWGPRGP